MHLKYCSVCGKVFKTACKYGKVCDCCKEFKENHRLDMLRNTIMLKKLDDND